MFWFNEELKELVKNYFGYTEEMVDQMKNIYTEKILALIINTSLEYIDTHDKKEDVAALEKLLQNPSKDPELLKQIYEFIFNLSKKYPEIEKIAEERISQLNKDLNKLWVDQLDEKTAIKIINLAAQEAEKLKSVDDYIQTARNKLQQKSSN